MKKFYVKLMILCVFLFSTNIFAQAPQGCVQPPSGMVAWWSLDETCGTTSNDLAQFNNAGTQINGPDPVGGIVLGGLQFDGINDYIEVPDHSELDFGTGDFSIDAWVQTTQSTGQLTIVNKIQFSLNRGYSLYLQDGEVRLILSASSPVFYVSSVLVADGDWHHIAVTVDRTDPSNTNGIKFYLDGNMISTSDPTTNPGTITAVSPLRIGSLSWTAGSLFEGSLDEIELFNRELDETEIFNLWNAGSAGKCKPATISGMKYNDINGNGSKDIGDLGLANWTITLEYQDGVGTLVTETATTCANGDYIFTGLSAGTYTVSETPQGGWTQTAPVIPGTYTIVLAAGQNSIDNDFGNQELFGSISGMKYNDLAGNGSMDGLDTGLPNWIITLEYLDGVGTLITETATTDANGDYIFTGLLAGTYTVSETQQGGWTQTAPVTPPGTYTIVLAVGQNSIDNDFGNQQLFGSICGMKFNDLAGNGIMDGLDTGLPNWIITLEYQDVAGNIVTQPATTDANGSYCFTNLTSNTYTVSETQQGGWTQTAPAVPGTYTIVLAAGQNSINNDFGNQPVTGCVDPPLGMVAWWPLDEIVGETIVHDIIGINNGSPQPGPIGVMGSGIGGPTPGSTLSFLQPPFMVDGSLLFYAGVMAKYVRVPDNTTLNFGSGDFSIDAWVYPVVGSNYVQPIVDKSVTTLTVCIGYRLFILNGQLNFVVMDGNTASVTIAPINYSQWQHLVAVRKGGTPNTIELYINGTLIITSTPQINNISNTTDLLIGGISNPSGGTLCGLPAQFNYGEIAIDELEIFNRALLPAEIFSIWNAGTFGKCKPSDPTDVKNTGEVPKRFELLQSYPNPFNPSTVISYSIPQTSLVKISVYDILGKEVQALVDEEKSPGYYEITFDAKGLASGIYFYTIRSKDFYQTRKMILLR